MPIITREHLIADRDNLRQQIAGLQGALEYCEAALAYLEGRTPDKAEPAPASQPAEPDEPAPRLEDLVPGLKVIGEEG